MADIRLRHIPSSMRTRAQTTMFRLDTLRDFEFENGGRILGVRSAVFSDVGQTIRAAL
jgi:hypothetical protein